LEAKEGICSCTERSVGHPECGGRHLPSSGEGCVSERHKSSRSISQSVESGVGEGWDTVDQGDGVGGGVADGVDAEAGDVIDSGWDGVDGADGQVTDSVNGLRDDVDAVDGGVGDRVDSTGYGVDGV